MKQIQLVTPNGVFFDVFNADGTLRHMRAGHNDCDTVPTFYIFVRRMDTTDGYSCKSNLRADDCAKLQYLRMVNRLYAHYVIDMKCVCSTTLVELKSAMRASWLAMTIANKFDVSVVTTHTTTKLLRVPAGRVNASAVISVPVVRYTLTKADNSELYPAMPSDEFLRVTYLDDIVSPTDEIVAGRVQAAIDEQARMLDTE